MELLPAERNTRSLAQARAADRALAQRHDAAIIVCDRERAAERSRTCRSAALWRRLHQQARERGPATMLSTRVSAAATPWSSSLRQEHGVRVRTSTLAARAWKELAAAAARSAVRDSSDAMQRRAARARSDGRCSARRHGAHADNEVEAAAPAAPASSRCSATVQPPICAHAGSRSRQSSRALADDAAAECPEQPELSPRAARRSRAATAGDSRSSTRRRCDDRRRRLPCGLARQRSSRRRHRSAALPRASDAQDAAAARARRQGHLLRYRRHQSQDRTRACTRCMRTCRAAP